MLHSQAPPLCARCGRDPRPSPQASAEEYLGDGDSPPPPSRTKWTRLVHPFVLTGHVVQATRGSSPHSSSAPTSPRGASRPAPSSTPGAPPARALPVPCGALFAAPGGVGRKARARAGGRVRPSEPPPSRTNWTRLVPPSRTNWTRLVDVQGAPVGAARVRPRDPACARGRRGRRGRRSLHIRSPPSALRRAPPLRRAPDRAGGGAARWQELALHNFHSVKDLTRNGRLQARPRRRARARSGRGAAGVGLTRARWIFGCR